MSLSPVTGLNTLNNLLKPFKVKIPIDAPVISYFTRMIITRELNLYFKRIREDDVLMSFEKLDNITEEELNFIAIRRGIEVQDKTFE
jgi:LETM1-like protein